MPCYLFTWHAYGTWMPVRPEGYVRRKQGVLPPDAAMATRYRRLQKEPTARFDAAVQHALLEEAKVTAGHRRFRLHGFAAETTHAHFLLSWRDERSYQELRRGLRESLSRRLSQLEKREWLTAGGSRKQVREQSHFDYLMRIYLPKHRGLVWREYDADVKQAS